MIKKIRTEVSPNTDIALIKNLKEGDRIAYSRLLGKYYDMVFLMLSALDDSGEETQVRAQTSEILFSIWTDRASIPADKPLKDHLVDFIYGQYKENSRKI